MKFCWITIYVSNMERSLQFYTEIVGLSIDRTIQASPTMQIAFLGKGETKVELICNTAQQHPTHGNDISVGFEVESLDRMIEILKEKKIAITSGPLQPNPHIKFLYVQDPDGVKIQFVENI